MKNFQQSVYVFPSDLPVFTSTYDIVDTAPDPERQAVNSGEGSQIDRCMQELDQGKADAVKLAYLEGRSYEELAARFDVPLNTMRTWLRRSLLKLRECLEQ